MSGPTHVLIPIDAFNAMAQILDIAHPGVKAAMVPYLSQRREWFEPPPPAPLAEEG